MISFLKAKITYFVAFLMILSFAIVPTFAQMDELGEEQVTTQEDMIIIDEEPLLIEPAPDEMYYITEEQEREWERAIDEWENVWEEAYEEDGIFTTMGIDSSDDYADLAALGVVFGAWLVIMGILLLPLYIYFALTLMVTANKLGVKNAWFAWIPILNIILMLQCAGLTPWLFLLMFVPFLNIIIMVFAYMKIAERRGFESWLGILIILPIANLIIPGYLAWGEPPKKAL